MTVVPKQPRKKNNYKHKKVFKILNSLEFLVLGAFVSSDVNLFLGIVFADRNIMMWILLLDIFKKKCLAETVIIFL